jgi:hypothetical protein
MSYVHEIQAHLGWASYAMVLLVGVLPDRLLTAILLRRGFGRRGFGGRGFGRGLGPFRLIRLARVVFVLLFTTILGPVVLIAILVFAGYWFFANRQR